MTPCERLLVAVVAKALKDASGRNPKEKAAALAFLRSEAIENVCDWVGLDSRKMRECHKFRMVTGGSDALHGSRF